MYFKEATFYPGAHFINMMNVNPNLDKLSYAQ